MELWEELNSANWKPIKSLGSKWLGKWTSTCKGYSLIVTDGVALWGEQRNADYVKQKSQEWATCLIAGVEELCDLFLSQLSIENSKLKLSTESRNCARIDLEGDLDDGLPYCWLFYLSSLPEDVVEYHWTLPIATTLEMMSNKLQKLEEELKKKNRQLEDLGVKKEVDASNSLALDSSIQKVFADGLGKVFSSQLSCSPILINKIIEKKKLIQSSKTLNEPHNRPKLKKPSRGFYSDESSEKQKAEEATRRAQIQTITYSSNTTTTPVKKKKKLNI